MEEIGIVPTNFYWQQFCGHSCPLRSAWALLSAVITTHAWCSQYYLCFYHSAPHHTANHHGKSYEYILSIPCKKKSLKHQCNDFFFLNKRMSRTIVWMLNCKTTPSPLTVSNRAVIREGYFKLNWITMKRKNMLISTNNHFLFFLFLRYSDLQNLKKQSDLIESPPKRKRKGEDLTQITPRESWKPLAHGHII